MLDDVPDDEGQLIQVPGAPGGVPQVVPPKVVPAAAPGGTGTSLKDVLQSAIAEGIYVTPPGTATPTARALEEIAQQCKSTPADASNGMRLLRQARKLTAVDNELPASDQKAPGRMATITVAPPAGKLPAGLECLTPANPVGEIKLELVVTARDYGPDVVVNSAFADVAAMTASVNTIFGDPQRPWRLARPAELLAIMSEMQNRSLWGPDGSEYWTSAVLTSGEHVVVKASTVNQSYESSLEVRPATARVRPVWVRDGSR